MQKAGKRPPESGTKENLGIVERDGAINGILDKVAEDAEFRNGLFEGRGNGISDEFGICIPENLEVQVRKVDANTAHSYREVPRKVNSSRYLPGSRAVAA